MNMFTRMSLAILAFCFALAFTACDNESSSDGASINSSLVGQWEGEMDDGGTTYDMFITIGSNRAFQNILFYQSDSGHFGNMSSGEKGTISTKGENLNITVKQDWSDGTWEEKATPEDREATYELSTDKNTLTIHILDDPETVDNEAFDLVLTRGTTPVVDPNLTGTWVATGLTDDWDDDSTDENVTITVTLGSDGSYSWVKTDDALSTVEDYVIESYTGTYGAFWWSAEPTSGRYENRFFAPTITTWVDREEDGTLNTYTSIVFFQRMASFLNMFGNLDGLILAVPDDGDITFERQEADPGLPAPDSSVVGYWLGVENDGGTDYDVIVQLKSDNTLERILLYQLSDTEHGGETYAGNRGQYTAGNGDMTISIESNWADDGTWSAASELFGQRYSVSGGVLSVLSSSGLQTFNSISAPAHSSSLEGTWVCNTTEDYDDDTVDENVSYTAVIDSDGVMSITMTDTDLTQVYALQLGTVVVSTVDSTDYITFIIELMDDTDPFNGVDAYDFYWVSRYTYTLTTTVTTNDTLTLGAGAGDMVFTKL